MGMPFGVEVDDLEADLAAAADEMMGEMVLADELEDAAVHVSAPAVVERPLLDSSEITLYLLRPTGASQPVPTIVI